MPTTTPPAGGLDPLVAAWVLPPDELIPELDPLLPQPAATSATPVNATTARPWARPSLQPIIKFADCHTGTAATEDPTAGNHSGGPEIRSGTPDRPEPARPDRSAFVNEQ